MRNKIASALTSLLILTTLLTTPYSTSPATSSSPSPEGVYHWKIELAQKKCNAFIFGYLTYEDVPILGTEFELNCTCEEEPQPPSQRVFWKVNTTVVPTDIHFWKSIDWNKDGIWDEVDYFVEGFLEEPEEGHRWYHHQQHLDLELTPIFGPIDLTDPICNELEELSPMPDRTYHLSSWEDTGWPYGELSYCDQVDLTPIEPPGPVDWWHVEEPVLSDHLLLRKLVVVEVHEQPYDPDFPWFEWQITMKTHGLPLPTTLSGNLTKDGVPLPGTDFDLVGMTDPDLQCQVVRTPYCTVPNDIYAELIINDMPPPVIIDEWILQFPWTYVYVVGPGMNVTLELTEVQMHHYTVMGGWYNTAGQIAAFPPWDLNAWQIDRGVPFATREPYLAPMIMGQNITFTQRDPITGIAELGIQAESYVGLDHMYYSTDLDIWFRTEIFLETQGCGWVFTEEGKEPVLGSVDLLTYNNYSGVWTYGPDQISKTADDELLAGELYGLGTESAGAGPPIGPCLQLLRGYDGIPGTGDDPIGRGDPDGPNPPGSSIVFLPTTLRITYWNGSSWQLLVQSPWPQLLTTGTANDTVIEPMSMINGATAERTGQPWEYFAGLDHLGQQVIWKDPKCNAYVHYVTVWSVLVVPTAFGNMDILFEFEEKKVRDDHVIADINCDEIADFKDLFLTAKAFGSQDETYPGKQAADPDFDVRADLDGNGMINILDLIRIAVDYTFIPGYHVPDSWQGTISMVPSSKVANVGQKFKVNVTVSGVTDLYLISFCLHWNTTVLNLTQITTPFPHDITANQSAGNIEGWTGTLLGLSPPATGTMATLEFEVIGPGCSPLDLYNCSWMNSTAGQFGFTTVQDGSFSMHACVFPVTWTWVNYTGVVVDFEANVTISGCCLVVQNFNFTRSCPGCPSVQTSAGHISFDVVSPGSPGSCNVTIPKPVMDGTFKVLLNDTVVPSILTWNESHTFVYFTYSQGTHNAKILGETVTRIRGPDLLTVADVNGDGIIDIVDIVIVALRFGWKEYK